MNFNKWADNANLFVKEIAREMDAPQDTARAGRALRLVLHTLRNRLDPEQGAHLVAQLPMFIKGLFVDGWRPSSTPDKSIRNVEDFVDAMYEEDRLLAPRDFPDRASARQAAQAVLRVIKRHVSAGEASDVAGMLPRDLKSFWLAA